MDNREMLKCSRHLRKFRDISVNFRKFPEQSQNKLRLFFEYSQLNPRKLSTHFHNISKFWSPSKSNKKFKICNFKHALMIC